MCSAQPCCNASVRSEQSQFSVVKFLIPFYLVASCNVGGLYLINGTFLNRCLRKFKDYPLVPCGQ